MAPRTEWLILKFSNGIRYTAENVVICGCCCGLGGDGGGGGGVVSTKNVVCCGCG